MMAQTTPQRSGLLAIIKKEFARFFTDRRMVLTTLLLPGLMIYLVYSFIGSAMGSMFTVDEDYAPTIYAVNLPPSVQPMMEGADLSVTPVTEAEAEGVKQQIADKEADLLIVFPVDFDEAVSGELGGGGVNGVDGSDGSGSSGVGGSSASAAQNPPLVEIYYNSTRVESSTMLNVTTGILDAYKYSLAPLFSVNTAESGYDLATEQDSAGFLLASLLPMVMMIVLFSGCMAIAPESVAGEKERGTIATMLITPLKRSELALGKVLSIAFISLLSGTSSFLGLLLSLPRMLGDTAASGTETLLYGVPDYLMLLAVTFATVLLFVGLISIISAFARSVKEAGTYVTPLMIVVMLIGVLGMFSQSAQDNLLYYLIPVYNSVQCMVSVFSFTANPLYVAVAVVENLLLTGLCVVLLTRMFNNEKIIFSR